MFIENHNFSLFGQQFIVWSQVLIEDVALAKRDKQEKNITVPSVKKNPKPPKKLSLQNHSILAWGKKITFVHVIPLYQGITVKS